MQPITEIGEMLITTKQKSYFLKPSFKNIYHLGNSREIVRIYAELHGQEIKDAAQKILTSKSPAFQNYALKKLNSPIFGRKILANAMNVIACCCDDDTGPLIGYWIAGKDGVKYRKGALSIEQIILIAKSLMEHGIIGRAKLDLPPPSESKNNYSNEFNIIEYISLARTHFGMTREEAENLTMTELQELLKSQMPKKKESLFTEEEYNSIMDEYEREKAKAIGD